MRLRWRLPVVLTACVVVAQFVSLDPLVDVVTWSAPASARLSYPVLHVVFAPFTLLADWLNGGSRRDLIGFGVWAAVAYALVRLAAHRAPAAGRGLREVAYAASAVVGLAAYVAWGVLAQRPIPRLVADNPEDLIIDVHSHTSASHDGRPGFGAVQNAAWHARAGFDAAFVTDHNVFGAASLWRREAAGRRPRLLDGEEVSLSGIHLLTLGIGAGVPHQPYDASWDSTGALIRRLHADSIFLVPTLPEDWRHHTGAEFGQLSEWGVDGFEIWTSAPQAMDLPPSARRTVISWSRLENRPMFGSTDMHGYGNAATVWNL
ncbi:MAG TPA: PHP domain-containing protein, partial [Gemmatimonadales bacterium]|nr:PHP domain-containing protein [Gemmatimonadales bacterium]